jgi:uncharacterized protein (DUF697 family)
VQVTPPTRTQTAFLQYRSRKQMDKKPTLSLQERIEEKQRERRIARGFPAEPADDGLTLSERVARKMQQRARQYKERQEAGVPAGKTGLLSELQEKLKKEITGIESRNDLTTEQKVKQITHITCAACAGIAIQPIPFADIFILTPIQAYMGSRIAAIRGVPISESEASTLIKEILGVIGMGFMAQQIAIAIWKTLIPGAGGFMTIPIVYGLSYAIMRVMDAYLVAKAQNKKLTESEIKVLWRNAKREGEQQGKQHESSIKR